MTTELTKAAQQALEALRNAQQLEHLVDRKMQRAAIAALERALTQRPAAQTEREAFECAALAKWGPLDFERSEAVPEMYYNQRLDDAWIGFGFAVAWLRASLPAPQQATPEPLTLGPLAKRNIYDAIRGAYDLGYNDARNARTVPGDSAPGYDGRSVEEDHGGALFNLLSKRLTPATPEPVGEPRQFPVLKGKTLFSVPWSMLVPHERQARANHGQSLERLAERGGLSPVEMVAVVLGKRWRDVEGMSAADAEASLSKMVTAQTRPAPGVPEDSALLDYLDTLAARPAGSDLHCFGGRVALYVRTGIGSQIEASGAGTAREAIRAALAAAQAKGGEQ